MSFKWHIDRRRERAFREEKPDWWSDGQISPS